MASVMASPPTGYFYLNLSDDMIAMGKFAEENAIKCDSYLKFIKTKSVLNKTLIENKFNQLVNDLKDIQMCCEDLKSISLSAVNDMYGHSSKDPLKVMSPSIKTEVVIDLRDDSEDGIHKPLSGQSNVETMDETNEDMNNRQEFITNGSHRDQQIVTNEDNSTTNIVKIEDNDKQSNKEMIDKTNTDCRQRVKRLKTIESKKETDLDTNDNRSEDMDSTDEEYVCNLSDEESSDESDIECKTKGIIKYRCDREGGNYKSGHKGHYEQHLISHSNERQFKCSLNDCNKAFKSKDTLTRHQLDSHGHHFPNKPWLKCSYNACKYETKCTNSLTEHMKCHSKPYKCDECGKGFGKSNHLKTHKTSHNDSRKMRCEWHGCDRLFTTQYIMRDHMNTHTLETTYPCKWPGCDKSYLIKASLNRHKNKYHKTLNDN